MMCNFSTDFLVGVWFEEVDYILYIFLVCQLKLRDFYGRKCTKKSVERSHIIYYHIKLIYFICNNLNINNILFLNYSQYKQYYRNTGSI